MGVTRHSPRYDSHWFADIVDAIVSREPALGIFTAAMREAYENGRADADQGAVEAFEKIERLRAKWDAPDTNGDEAWAAVGSEAHKIAADYLRGR